MAGGSYAPPLEPIKGRSGPAVDHCSGPISYSNVSLGYAHTFYDFGDDIDIDSGNGVGLALEYSPFQNVYLAATGSYQRVEGFDAFGASAGIGGWVPLTENFHFAIDGGVVYSEIEDFNETGWYVKPHVRAKFSCFEVHAGAKYTDLGEDADQSWTGFVDGFYQVARHVDIGMGVSFDEDATSISAGVRFKW